MSFKDWAEERYWQWKEHKLYRRLCACLLFLIILVLIVIFLVWLLIRPSKPKFNLQDATVLQFNLSDHTFLSSVIQVTISSHNPNDHIGIYYDRLDVYADYNGQQITVPPTALLPLYQDHHYDNVWSPYLNGTAVHLAPYIAAALQDHSDKSKPIDINIDGMLRWKVGPWISGHYLINVKCPAFFTFDSTNEFRFQLEFTSCSVDV